MSSAKSISIGAVSSNLICPVCNGSGIENYYESNELTRTLYGDDRKLEFTRPCPKCNGVNYEKIRKIKQFAAIPERYAEARLKNFDWNIYNDKSGKVYKLDRQRKFVDSLINNFETWNAHGQGLYIYSAMKGSGKTFLSSCIANELINEYGEKVRFVNASELLDIAKSGEKGEDPIKNLCSCRVLVIDDLGVKQTGGEWLNDVVFRIIDARYQYKRMTIITSNVELMKLNLDDRIVDRINNMCTTLALPECSIRAKQTNTERKEFLKKMGLI